MIHQTLGCFVRACTEGAVFAHILRATALSVSVDARCNGQASTRSDLPTNLMASFGKPDSFCSDQTPYRVGLARKLLFWSTTAFNIQA